MPKREETIQKVKHASKLIAQGLSQEKACKEAGVSVGTYVAHKRKAQAVQATTVVDASPHIPKIVRKKVAASGQSIILIVPTDKAVAMIRELQ